MKHLIVWRYRTGCTSGWCQCVCVCECISCKNSANIESLSTSHKIDLSACCHWQREKRRFTRRLAAGPGANKQKWLRSKYVNRSGFSFFTLISSLFIFSFHYISFRMKNTFFPHANIDKFLHGRRTRTSTRKMCVRIFQYGKRSLACAQHVRFCLLFIVLRIASIECVLIKFICSHIRNWFICFRCCLRFTLFGQLIHIRTFDDAIIAARFFHSLLCAFHLFL